MAKYPYIVKKNNKWYPAGTEVPDGIKSQNENVKQSETQYTKTEINRMTTAELQDLAVKNGIDGAESITGAELKKILAEKFGL